MGQLTNSSQLLIVTNPSGAGFSLSGSGCSPGNYTAPSVVQKVPGTVCAISFGSPQAVAGNRLFFQSWTDGSTANPRSVSAPASAGATAVFTANFLVQVPFSWQVSPPLSGGISLDPGTINGYYDAGTLVQVSAVPNSGYAFAGWSGDLKGTSDRQTLLMSTARNVTAHFVRMGDCVYFFEPATSNFAAHGGTFSNTLTVSGTGCAWSAFGTEPWINVLSGSPGIGSGPISFSIAPNTGGGRSGALIVAGQRMEVHQSGGGPAAAPDFVSLTPFIATGPVQAFTAVYRDGNGFQDLWHLRLLIHSQIAADQACYLEFDRATYRFKLVNDAGTLYLPFVSPGSGSVSNSQCTLNGTGSYVSGNGNDFAVTFAVTFHASFAGRKRLYLLADDSSRMTSDWNLLGEVFPQFTSASLKPRYRLYHPGTRAHLHTTDGYEYTALGTRGWIQEGISGRVFDAPTSVDGVLTVPIYRLYFHGGTRHFWTTDRNEYLTLMRMRTFAVGEGPDGYILPQPVGNTIALFRLLFCCSPTPIHHWTTDAYEYSVLGAPSGGWVQEGVAGYIYPATGPIVPSNLPLGKEDDAVMEQLRTPISILTTSEFGYGTPLSPLSPDDTEVVLKRGGEVVLLARGLDVTGAPEPVVAHLNGLPVEVIAIEHRGDGVSAVRLRVSENLERDSIATVSIRAGELRYSQPGVTVRVQ